MLPGRDRPRARRRPSRPPRRPRSALPWCRSSRASRRPRAPRRPSRCRSSSPRRCPRSRRPRCRCSGSIRCAAGSPPIPVREDRRDWRASWCRCRGSSPPGRGSDELPLNSSATAKISSRATSMTGVPVMPTVGAMSPQGTRCARGTGVPTWLDHTMAPVLAASAYIVSFSVATIDTPRRLERLAVDRAVEHRRLPCRVGRRERDAGRVDPATERVAVVDGPRRPGAHSGERRRSCRRSSPSRQCRRPTGGVPSRPGPSRSWVARAPGGSTHWPVPDRGVRPRVMQNRNPTPAAPVAAVDRAFRARACDDDSETGVNVSGRRPGARLRPRLRRHVGPGAHDGGRPGVVGLARRRALDRVDDVEAAGQLVPRDGRPAVLLE